MAFQLSPGVNVSEIDLTTVVPAVATTDGAFAGVMRWGPVGELVLVDSELQLVNRFGKPTNFNAESWFTCSNFLSYTNRLWISRAANTSGATPTVGTIANTATNNYICNTYGLTPGMYLTQSSNHEIVIPGNTVSIVTLNSTAVILSSGPAVNGSVQLYFGHNETSYSAVALAAENAIVANLVNQIIPNEEAYIKKDGDFDPDILWIARYPAGLGNSLRISVCDTANAFQSNIALGAHADIEFRVGANVATVKFDGFGNTDADTVLTEIGLGDQILTGNSLLSQQYLKVTNVYVSNTWVYGNTVGFDGNLQVNGNTGFIRITNNPFTNGDILTYANAAGELPLDGLTPGVDYHVVAANSIGIKLATDPFASPILVRNAAGSNGTLTSNTTTLVIETEDPYRLRANYVSNTINRFWEFVNVFDKAPAQSQWVQLNGNSAAQDELSIVLVDDDGGFTGIPGTILETYNNLSRATDAKNSDGSTNYYKDVINQGSQYIWYANDRPEAPSANAHNVVSSTNYAPYDMNFVLGTDGHDETTASLGILGDAWDYFGSPENIDISLVLSGRPIGGTTVVKGQTISNYQLANYLIDNIATIRKDCVVFISPDRRLVVSNPGDEAISCVNYRDALHSSSYAVMDSGYKYQYDKYNDVYRWVPLNGDIAGLCAATDQTNDAWWSPAGYNRGQIKNVVKLAWNPRKAERDILYSNGVNPVITDLGQGTILFGDKTLQARPSAFDRINVRRLFIVLEKAISRAAKYSLFEFNDAFTRAQFKNLVTPYLRTVQGRRGITDFLVVCDDTNNTPQIIDTNQFVGDIYIKPARSINFIQLNFIAVPTGVQFSEVVGKF
jgi:hypothetical protein